MMMVLRRWPHRVLIDTLATGVMSREGNLNSTSKAEKSYRDDPSCMSI